MNFLAWTAWTTWTEDGSYSLQVSAREIGHSNFQKKFRKFFRDPRVGGFYPLGRRATPRPQVDLFRGRISKPENPEEPSHMLLFVRVPAPHGLSSRAATLPRCQATASPKRPCRCVIGPAWPPSAGVLMSLRGRERGAWRSRTRRVRLSGGGVGRRGSGVTARNS